MIQNIIYKKKLLALIVKGNYRKKKGISFFTPNESTQQFGYMKHKKNHIILPHLHKKRTTYFVCIKGKVVFIIENKDGTFIEIESGEDNPVLVQVPPNFASAHVNLNDETSSVLVLADIAWRPNDNEMINLTFDNYDWKKWETL